MTGKYSFVFIIIIIIVKFRITKTNEFQFLSLGEEDVNLVSTHTEEANQRMSLLPGKDSQQKKREQLGGLNPPLTPPFLLVPMFG